MAQGVGVEHHGGVLVAGDDVAGVEHVEYAVGGREAVGHGALVGGVGGPHGIVAELGHVAELNGGVQDALDEVFVSVELGRVVAAYHVVEIRAVGAPEAGNIHHAVIALILSDEVVYRVGLDKWFGGVDGHETVVGNVAFVGRIEVDENERSDACDGEAAFEPSLEVAEQQSAGKYDKNQCMPAVAPNHSVA